MFHALYLKTAPLEAIMPGYIRTMRITLLLFALIAFVPMAAAAPGGENKPNIVLVLMDNFGYG